VSKRLRFGDLHRILEQQGFEQSSGNDPYVVFRHTATGALQAFRAHRAAEAVDAMSLASVRKTLVEFGFMDESEFEEALSSAGARRGAKSNPG
jgi:hypothetical protein